MRYLIRTFVEIWRSVRFQPLSVIGTIVTIFLAMIMPGLFWVASNNLAAVESELREDLTINVFLTGNPTNDDIKRLRGELLIMEGVSRVDYFSKQDALFKMRESFGQQVIQDLDENPLPASFSLIIDEDILTQAKTDSIIGIISSMAGVDEVVFPREFLDRIKEITGAVKNIGIAMTFLVILSAIFISANTIRTAITDRKEVVAIMQIVGATRSYILTPFVILGGMIGLIGAALAILILWYGAGLVSNALVELSFLNISEMIAFVLSGLLFGMVGALLATRRHLKL